MIQTLIFTLEEMALFMFPFILFKYHVKYRWFVVLLISLIFASTSLFIRQYLQISFSIFVVMGVGLLLLYAYIQKITDSILLLATGYVFHTGLQAIILFISTLILKKNIQEIVVDHGILTYVPILTSAITFVIALCIQKFKLQIILPDTDKHSTLTKQTNVLISIFSVIGLILVIQTVTLYVSSQTTTLGLFGEIGLFLVFVLIIRNVKIMQEQIKIEEEKIYLENTVAHINEVKEINKDFYNQMETLQQMLTFQDKIYILNYLEHLLSERKFIATSIEIHEPMLKSFLQKERHICQSFGINFIIKATGQHYITPQSITGYQLNRILQQIMEEIVFKLKEKNGAKNINLVINTNPSEINFNFRCDTQFTIPRRISGVINMHNGEIYMIDVTELTSSFVVKFKRG